jgi:hypothetical protein
MLIIFNLFVKKQSASYANDSNVALYLEKDTTHEIFF